MVQVNRKLKETGNFKMEDQVIVTAIRSNSNRSLRFHHLEISIKYVTRIEAKEIEVYLGWLLMMLKPKI
jgi:hypothetical protein